MKDERPPAANREPPKPVPLCMHERRGNMSIASPPPPPQSESDSHAGDGILSVRSLLLLSLAATAAGFVALHPAAALPIGIGIAVLTLLHATVSRRSD